jgi:glycoside/pentoside/hexuronide:cation symporter, GPH family
MTAGTVGVSAPAKQHENALPEARLSFLTKFCYGFGEAAEGVKGAALETFLFFYYVQVVGLSGSLTGLALMIALVIDGFIDPMIGNFSDNFRSRLGRRHPFLYFAPLPLAAFLFLLFSPPSAPGSWGVFAWLLAFTSLSRLMQSLYFVPHMALGAELSTDFKERVSVSAYRTLFAYLARALLLAFAFSVFFKASDSFPNGQTNPAAYSPFASSCGAVVIIVIVASALGTQKRALTVYRAQVRTSLHHSSGAFLRNLVQAFRLRSFALYFMAVLASYVLGGVQAALNIHLNTYYWHLPPEGLRAVFVCSMVGFMAGTWLGRPLSQRFDKKPVYIVCAVTSVLVTAMPIVLAQSGLYPVRDKQLLSWCLAFNTFAAGFIGSPAVVIAGAMLADVADAYELRFKARSEGLLFGASAFTRKASLGVGGALAGLALDFIQFPRGVPVEAVPREAAVNLALLYGPAMLIFTAIAMTILWKYDLTREKHAEILRALGRGH